MSIKHCLLALLYQEPMHGYELGKQLNLVIGIDRAVKLSQIAQTLTRLKEADLVDYKVMKGRGAPDRKVYTITSAGIEELRRWYLTPDSQAQRFGGTFALKLMLSLVNARVRPEEVLKVQHQELCHQFREATQLSRQFGPQDPWRRLLVDHLTMHLEVDFWFLEKCETHLADLHHYRLPVPEPRSRGRHRRVTS